MTARQNGAEAGPDGGVLPLRRRLRRLVGRFRPSRLAATCGWFRNIGREVSRRRREKRLTVAVDVSPFWEPLSGVGWSLLRLLEAMAGREDVRLRLYGPGLFDAPDCEPPVHPLPVGPALELVAYPDPSDLSIPHRLLRLALRLVERRLVAADRNRVLFAPNFVLSPRLRAARGALVATVHDLVVYRYPETMEERTRRVLEGQLAGTLSRARALITVSHAIRDELISDRGVAEERVHVVYPGPGSVGAASAARLPRELPTVFVLFVGTLEPRKNLRTLLTAWDLLFRSKSDAPPLVVCGRLGWKEGALRPAIDDATASGRLRMLGYVDSDTLAALYAQASLVVLPSLYEGFGLPVLEAMGAGAPLVLSDIPVLREVAEDAALYADPLDPEAWAAAVVRVLGDAALAERLGEVGRARAARFDWAQSAAQIVDIFHRVGSTRAASRLRVGRRASPPP